MKDFAKSVRTNNMRNDAKAKELFDKMMEAKEIADGWGRMSSSQKGNLTGGLQDAKDAYSKARREYETYAQSDEKIKKTGNTSNTKEEAKTKDEYFKLLKFYQTQGYKTNAGEYNPNGRIKLHKGDDSVEIVLVGNSKVGNYILNLMDQANEYSKGFSEALKKGDKAEAEKVSGYAKILKRQIKEERDEIQKRLKELDNAERIMGSVGNSKPKVGNSNTFDRLDDAIHYAGNLVDNALHRLSSPYSATNIVSDLSKCKQACDEAIKLAIKYDKERNK